MVIINSPSNIVWMLINFFSLQMDQRWSNGISPRINVILWIKSSQYILTEIFTVYLITDYESTWIFVLHIKKINPTEHGDYKKTK